MINTHENKMVLPRKAEKLCNGLSRRNGPNIPSQQAFLLVAFQPVQWQIFGLSLSVNPGASLLAKKI